MSDCTIRDATDLEVQQGIYIKKLAVTDANGGVAEIKLFTPPGFQLPAVPSRQQPPARGGRTMDTGKALEIVHGMATRLYGRHGELDPATTPSEAQEALDTVEDFIVNNFEADDSTPNAALDRQPADRAEGGEPCSMK